MNDKTKLPRARDTTPFHAFFLRIPLPVRERMIKEAKLQWGGMTQFILDAIYEKLDRMKKDTQ